jgi:hypothetical protein
VGLFLAISARQAVLERQNLLPGFSCPRVQEQPIVCPESFRLNRFRSSSSLTTSSIRWPHGIERVILVAAHRVGIRAFKITLSKKLAPVLENARIEG